MKQVSSDILIISKTLICTRAKCGININFITFDLCITCSEQVMFPDFTNCDDVVAKEQFQQSPHNALAQEALQLIFQYFQSTTQISS